MEYFDTILNSIYKSVNSIDQIQFRQLVDDCCMALDNGNRIIASGLGKNVPICEKFVGTMNSLSLEAGFLHTNSAIHGDLGMVKKNDIVIILSKSGETEESIYLARLLRQRQTKLWLLSFKKHSILTNLIEKQIILELDHEGDLWNIMPNNSTTINLIVLQALAINIAKMKQLTINDFKCNHPGGHIGKILE